MFCILCGKPAKSGKCDLCPPEKVEARECLLVCREGFCMRYDDEDRCMMLSRPCQLPRRLNKGYRCKLGYHDNIGTAAP